ncbi:acyltransferase family protein [Calothrix sp. UHCC 0171]|uniref:acyltransferase family protein n=1 Tax=Calothrix sp. UHCC 0171 TaxID=3110245 RepID=UPI002B1ED0E2|nr:heparan-alpha-glucosaminide N-acetyltransferase domain-containing protein [Calothrix sp. UHCC 0171]MEA5572337.1 heparan-alpha-glucosaminide N-acetyltransferase domain-containing protein [Calothrix sp. UHCC 0171]
MRLTSLDVFRGFTIAGMILVNMVSLAAPDVYPQLLHANWNGCTFADLVFPFFLFIVGVAIAFSFAKYDQTKYKQTQVTENEKSDNETSRPSVPTPPYGKIFRRALILFALGLFLNGFWNQGTWTFNLENLRYMGVLQRISLSYLFASLAALTLPRQGQWILAGVLLVGYWLAMMYIPVPGFGAGILDVNNPDANLAAFIDRSIIPSAHLHASFKNLGDPEGLFSTIPAIVSTMFGYFAGQWLLSQPVKTRTSIGLVLAGVGCLIVGFAWDWIFPINKKLWTSSYVIFTTGWALIFLAAFYELIEVRLIKKWGKPFEVMGMNAIAIFVASVLLIKVMAKTIIGTGKEAPNAYTVIYKDFFASWAGGVNGSFLFAFVTLLLWLGVAWIMYRQRWFIKI